MAISRPAQMGLTKLVVADLSAQSAFYRAVFGYGEGQFIAADIAGRRIEEIIFAGPQGNAELVLLQFLDEPPPAPHGVILMFYTGDLDGFQTRLLAAGGTIIEAIKPLDMGKMKTRMAIFSDVEGFMLEVLER